ncbi:MAG: ATP-binding protein [Planctomycetota bacterium JB042]
MAERRDASLSKAHRARARFFREYYAPLGANSIHGLAAIDTSSCLVLYANTRFLAAHAISPTTKLPFPCHELHGLPEPCPGSGDGCPAAEACRSHLEVRRSDTLRGGDGRPERTTEVVAYPLSVRSEYGSTREAVVVEKERDALAGRLDGDREREHLATIARHSADAIIGLDGDGRILSWNVGAEEIFGYTPEEVEGREFRFLVPSDEKSQQAFDAGTREFERRGILKNTQSRLVAKDGRTVVVSSTFSLVRDPTGGAIGVSVICRDVTMEVLLKELIDHQIRAMTVTHEIGEVLHSSRSVEEILQLILVGVTAGQGLGFNRAFLVLSEEVDGEDRLRGKMAIGPSNPEEAGRIWSRLSNERLSLTELYQVYLDEGATHDVRVNAIVTRIDVPLSDEENVLVRSLKQRAALNVLRGRVIGEESEVDERLMEALECDSFAVVPLNTRERAIGVLVVDNRITGIGIGDADLQMLKVFANHAGVALENSQLRESLEHRLDELALLNRKMKESQERLMHAERLSVIGEMAARIVHEVRNPLVSIGGFARMLRRGFESDDPRTDYLRIIADEVARLERIIQELLDYSRPQNRVAVREVDAVELVREVVEMATIEAAEHGVKVRQSHDGSIGRVRIDPDKTRQVLLNIVRNALDAMVGAGELSVETKRLDGDRFRVTIADTGPGIPPERREEVFEPGFTTRQDGTGFGLAIARRLIELQGGQIGLRDSVPVGCTFDIVMPCRVDPTDPESRDGDQP